MSSQPLLDLKPFEQPFSHELANWEKHRQFVLSLRTLDQ